MAYPEPRRIVAGYMWDESPTFRTMIIDYDAPPEFEPVWIEIGTFRGQKRKKNEFYKGMKKAEILESIEEQKKTWEDRLAVYRKEQARKRAEEQKKMKEMFEASAELQTKKFHRYGEIGCSEWYKSIRKHAGGRLGVDPQPLVFDRSDLSQYSPFSSDDSGSERSCDVSKVNSKKDSKANKEN